MLSEILQFDKVRPDSIQSQDVSRNKDRNLMHLRQNCLQRLAFGRIPTILRAVSLMLSSLNERVMTKLHKFLAYLSIIQDAKLLLWPASLLSHSICMYMKLLLSSSRTALGKTFCNIVIFMYLYWQLSVHIALHLSNIKISRCSALVPTAT